MLNDMPDGLELRPATASDQTFMKQLFCSTREYLRALPLPEPQIEALLEQQYQLQQAHYARQWPNARTLVIQQPAGAIGKIMLDESEAALHIIDIILETAMRGKGHGTSIIRALQAASQKRGLPINLSVDRQNPPAKKLYLRLGFKVTGTSDTHESMIWPPSLAMAAEG